MSARNERRRPAARALLATALAALLALPGHAAPPTRRADPVLEARLDTAIRGGDYRPSDPAELARAERLFRLLAAGTAPIDVIEEIYALALEIEDTGEFVIVSEREDARRGRGFFVFRRHGRGDVLHIPHGFFDEMTRDIGLALFTDGRFAAAAWNTVPRHYERDGARINADLAHLPDSWFTAFARATAHTWPHGRSLQIHGFDPAKRRSPAGADSALILSDTTEAPPPALRAVRDCLARRLDRRVALYPQDVRELGGTTNIQAQTLREAGYRGFLHIELDPTLRRALRDTPAARTAFLACFQP